MDGFRRSRPWPEELKEAPKQLQKVARTMGWVCWKKRRRRRRIFGLWKGVHGSVSYAINY